MSNIQIRDFTSYTDYLPLQFADSENLIKLLSIYLDQVEELNLAQQDLSNLSTDINTATGYQLDIIGNLLGAVRGGANDEDYRNYIRFRISINTGSGTPEDVINFVKSVTSATRVRYWEHHPASLVVETNGASIPTNIGSTVDNVSPAGVKTGGVLWVEGDYAFRPCRLSEAYANSTLLDTPDSYEMGDGDAYMGNPDMEMLPNTPSYDFSEVSPNTLLGQSILPNISEVYSEFYTGAGDEAAFADEPTAVASGLAVNANGIVLGTLCNVLTDINN